MRACNAKSAGPDRGANALRRLDSGILEKYLTQEKLSQSKLSKGDAMAFRGREHELSLMK